MNNSFQNDMRLIEAGFPCHQVGAETQRERDTGKSPPPNRLHVWWARRPLTPSRAAILASLLPADTDPDWFLRQLGIEKRVVEINGVEWTLTGKLFDKIKKDENDQEVLPVDSSVLGYVDKENELREKNREIIQALKNKDSSLSNNTTLLRWEFESVPIGKLCLVEGNEFEVKKVAADPAWFKDLMVLAGIYNTRVPNLYGYDRAYKNQPKKTDNSLTILDPTSGGGSIPFEALRLGHKVIANELNPVASVILHATLEYPAKYGKSLLEEIQYWGDKLLSSLDDKLDSIFPRKHVLPQNELVELKEYLKESPSLIDSYNKENTTSYLYCRQVTCPHCNGDAPLLNTCWLSKQSGKQWGVKIIPDGKPNNGTVRFETYRILKEKGPKGEDPGFATVNRGVGHCIHSVNRP